MPNETPESVRAKVEKHVEKQGYFIVHDTPDAATRAAHPRVAKLVWNMAGSYPPARTSPDLPVSREVISIVRKVSGDVVILPTLGGSIPMYLFRGEAPVHEMAAMFPQPMKTGFKLFGKRFLPSYPFEEAYLLPYARQFRAALKMPLVLSLVT